MTSTNRGVAAAERAELCDLLERLGPGVPTLCEGWTGHDMAAHLVTREARPDAVPGLLLAPAAAYTARLEAATAASASFPELLGRLRGGPPLLSLVALDAANVHEFFVHHEDVRRANDARPRPLGPRLERALWSRLRLLAPLLLRRAKGVEVTLERPDGARLAGRRGSVPVRLRAPVGELFLYLFNRRGAAEVEVDGDADGMRRLAAARLGL